MVWSALPGSLSGAVSQGPSSVLASLTQHSSGPWASSEFQPGEWSPVSTTFRCSFFFSRHLWQASCHSISYLCSTSIRCLISTAASYSATIIVVEYPVGPIVFRSQCNVLNKASYRSHPPSPRDFTSHSPYLIIHSGKTPTPLFHTCLWVVGRGPLSERDYQASPSLLLTSSSFLDFTILFQKYLQLLSPRTLFHLRFSHLSALEPNCDLLRKIIRTWKWGGEKKRSVPLKSY